MYTYWTLNFPSLQLACEYEWSLINCNNSTFTGLFLRSFSFSVKVQVFQKCLRVSSCLFMIRFVLAAASITFCVHEWEQRPTSGHDSSASLRVMVIPSVLLLLHNCPQKGPGPLGVKVPLWYVAELCEHEGGAEMSPLSYLLEVFCWKCLPLLYTSMLLDFIFIYRLPSHLMVAGKPFESSMDWPNAVLQWELHISQT